jgi:hypothetical protein
MDLSDINLLDRDRFTQGVPHEWFTYLRNNAPVYKHPEPDGPGFSTARPTRPTASAAAS